MRACNVRMDRLDFTRSASDRCARRDALCGRGRRYVMRETGQRTRAPRQPKLKS